MNSKTNEILNDIIHTASQAILCEDEAIKRQAMGDIIDALANFVPADMSARCSNPIEIDDVIDNLTTEMIAKICERHGLKKRMTNAEYMTVAEGCKLTRFKATNATRLIAVRKGLDGNADVLYEISVDHDNATAVIERDGEMMYQIKTLGLSYRRCVHAAIQVLRSHIHENDGVHRRHKKSRHLRAGILTPEKEVSETVARQMDDEDLAQMIENS